MDIKIGDVVRWPDLPDGVVARDDDGDFVMRVGDEACWVGLPGLTSEPEWQPFQPACDWQRAAQWRRGRFTIVALDVPADATADDLRALAEVFEVREALRTEPGLPGFTRVYLDDMMVGGFSGGDGLTHWAGRLHRAGWRPGMTAEDAARMLAEVRDGEA